MSRQQTSAPFGVPRGDGGVSHVPTVVDANGAASEIFDQFCTANTFQGIMGYFQQMCDLLGVRPEDHEIFYRKLKPRLVSWKAQSLWARLDRCATRREYKKSTACTNTRVLIIGAGPCGLRVAIEVAFLGGKAVIVEKRDRFSRNNVLHLWPYLIHDLKALGAKKFFGKFCASSIDHISIRTLQCILLKAALLVGVEIHPGVSYESILEPVGAAGGEGEEAGWRVKVSPADHPVSEFEFDVLLGADGKRNTLAGFRRKEFRGKLAIAVTANFINHNTQQEARVEEISGVAFIFNQKFFRELNQKTNVDLENIVYYKDETHYFVMTAKKHSLLIKGVILQDYDDPERLLARSNVDQDALMAYAKEAAEVSTNHLLPDLEFAHNHYGQADVAMFDFTSMYHAEHASRVIERAGHKLLVALVGDSLLEPFWPMGTGCARGFLGAQDTAWMIRSWASGRQTPLEVMAERESIYQLLSQTTPENTCKNFSQYTIDPKTRYTNLNPHYVLPHQVKHQYDGGDLVYLNEIVQISEQNCKRYEWMRDQHYLLKWFQRQLEPYRSRIKVLDMTTSWRSGVALCALIHHYRPDLVDVYALCPNKVSENNQMAFDLAEREFGIKPMMTGEDMAMCDTPDLVTMVSYLSQFYEHFRKQVKVIKDKKPSESLQARLARMSKINSRIRQRKDEEGKEDKENQQGEGGYKRPIFTYGMAKKRIKEMNDENNGEGGGDALALDMEERKKRLGVRKDPTLRGLESGMLGKNTVSVLAEDLAKKFRGEEPSVPEPKKLNPQPLTLGQAAPVDVCHFCGKKVYLVEKCMAEGVYFHRGCFRCHYCGTNLRLGAYTFQRGNGEEAMFFCFQHYGLTKPARRAKKRTYADNGGQVPSTPSPGDVNPDLLDGVGSTPERIEFDIESEQEESELEQTAHNLSGSIYGDESDSDSDESSDDEQHWSDPEVSDGQMSWADLADTYRRQLRRSMRRRHSQQQQLGGTDSDDTATIGSSCESWVSESETEKESEADELKDPPRRKKMRKQEVKPESRFTLDPLSHSFGVDTKPSPTSVEMMRSRMSFFSVVSEPVRIDAHEFLGLVPPARVPPTSGGTREVQTGKVQGAVLTRLSGAVPPVAIVTSDDDDDESETEKVGTSEQLVDSDTTPTEPSVTLAEQENSDVGEDYDGTGEETGDEEDDEREMKRCMERLLSEEDVDGGLVLDEACLESSDISDYDERHDLDQLVENNEGGLSDEMLETDVLVQNADVVRRLEQADVRVVDDASVKDLQQTDALVISNDGGVQALGQTDALVSDNLTNACAELERTDVLVQNNASRGEGVESRPKVTEASLELDQTNTLVAINSDPTNVSQQLNQTDLLVANNLESTEGPQRHKPDAPVKSSVDSKNVSSLEQTDALVASNLESKEVSPLERTDALVESNLESTEVSPLEQTDALVASNSEDTLEGTNLSDLVACNLDQLSDDDSLLRPQLKHESVTEVSTGTTDVLQQHTQPDVLVAKVLESTDGCQNEETPDVVVESKVDSKDVSPPERTVALVESKVNLTEVSPLEQADALVESNVEPTEVPSLEQTNALVVSNLEDTLEATNLSDLVACNVDQLSDDDSLLCPQAKQELIPEVPTSDDHGTGTLVSGESEGVSVSDSGEVVSDIAKTEVVDSKTPKGPAMVDQPTKDSPVVVKKPTEECPVVTEAVDKPRELDDGSVSLDDTHTISLLAATNADPLSDTGNLSDMVTLNAQQLMHDDSLLCDSEPRGKLGAAATRHEADVTKPEADVTKPEADVTRPKADVTKPVADVTRPETDVTKSGKDVIAPAKDVNKPEADVVKLEEDITKSQTAGVKESVKPKDGQEDKVKHEVEAVLETSAKDKEVCPVKDLGKVEPKGKGKEADIAKVDTAIVQKITDINTVKSAESKTHEVRETRQNADLTEDRQTDTTINAMVTDNLPDAMERSVDLSQLVATNTGHLPVDDSVFDPSVTSGETVAPSAVNGHSVTSDASEKSSIEADAIKRIDSLLQNLSHTELAEFGRDSTSSQSAEPSLVEVSVTDDEQGPHVVVVNETFVNTSDRRRRKHMSSSSSTTDTKSTSSVPSDRSKQPDSEDSLSLDKMVAANAGPCNGSMDEMLKINATPDSSLAKLDPISRVDALIGNDGSARKLGATPRLTPDLRKASSTSGLTGSDESFHTPSACPKDSATATSSKMSNPKLQNLSSHISTSEPKLMQEKHRLDSCKSWSDSQSDTSDQRSLTSLRTTGSSNSSPLYSPNQAIVDAKRKFFFDTPQPVRFDHRALLKDVGKSERDMDRGITDTSTPVEGNTAHAINGSPDVFFTPATSMKPKGKVAGRPRGADIRRQVLMKSGTPEPSNGGESDKTDTPQLIKSTSLQTQPIDIVGSNRERERPSVAQSLPEKSFSVDSPYKTAMSSTPPPRGKASKALKKQKSKDDEKENKRGKRRSFLSMFLPSKNTDKKEKGAGKERALSPETPEKTGKSKGVAAREKGRKEKVVEEVRPTVVVRPQGRKEARRPLTLTKDEAENRRSVYDEFGPLMGDMFGEQWKDATRERLEMVAPPPAKAPHTALLAPKAALEEFDTESELGDDMMSVRSFQSQGLSEDECARLHKKQAKAALRKRREQEQQRLHVAQQIQRQLEEVEVKQREVEKRGVVIERVLRGDGPDTQREETELMQMWFNIVHEKNLLVRYESELMVHARELELEDRHSRLEQQYRERMQMNDAEKTLEMREEDERLLQELLEVVEQRDALVAMLEEDRVKQRKQDEELREMMLLKGYELSPNIPEYKWQPPQTLYSSASDTR